MVRQCGFTLIEIALVVAIAGLVLAGTLPLISSVRTNAALKSTRNFERTLELAFQSHLARTGALPCPAAGALPPDNVDYGVAVGCVIQSCTPPFDDDEVICAELGPDNTRVYFGVLPFKTLQLQRPATLDGWGNQFSYAVSNGAVLQNAISENDLDGILEVTDEAGNTVIPNAVAIVVSHGANESGARTEGGVQIDLPVETATHERENTDNDEFAAAADYSDDDVTPFDDIVVAFTEERLVRALAAAGTVVDKHALARSEVNQILDAVLTAAASDVFDLDGAPTIDPDTGICTLNCREERHGLPTPSAPSVIGNATAGFVNAAALGLPPAMDTDPWGRPYVFVVNQSEHLATNTGIHIVMTQEPLAVRIVSGGPDRVAPITNQEDLDALCTASTQDICATVSAAGIYAWLLKSGFRVTGETNPS